MISVCISASSSQLEHLDSLWISLMEIESECDFLIDVYLNGTNSQNDEYVSRVKNLVSQGYRINYRTRKFGFLGESRNWMITSAVGDFIMFIDGDDYIIPRNFNWLLKKLDSELSNASVIAFKAQTDEDGLIRGWHSNAYPSTSSLERANLLNWFSAGGWRLTSACVKIYNRRWLRAKNLKFNEELFYEDTPFWFDVVESLEKIHFVHLEIYRYRRWSSTQITGSGGKRVFDIFGIFEVIKAKLRGSNEPEMKIGFYSFVLEHLVWTVNSTDKKSMSRKNRDFLQLEINEWAKEASDYLGGSVDEVLAPKTFHALSDWYGNRYLRYSRYLIKKSRAKTWLPTLFKH
jgi:hypothetical protein